MAQQAQLVEWYERFRKPVQVWLGRRCGILAKDTDDLAQETFMRLMRYPNDEVVKNPAAYLFTIAHNVSREWQERSVNQKTHTSEILDELIHEAPESHEDEFWRATEREAVRAAVDLLPPRQRKLLLMHTNDGLTYKQIATKEGLTYRTVLRDLTRSYSFLRNRLRDIS